MAAGGVLALTVRDLSDFLAASAAGGRLVTTSCSPGILSAAILRLAPLAESGAGDAAFFFSKNYQHELPGARPTLLITGEPFVGPLEAAGLPLWKSSAVVACRDPYLAMALLSEKFAELNSSVGHLEPPRAPERHGSAAVDPSAQIGSCVQIGAHCVI